MGIYVDYLFGEMGSGVMVYPLVKYFFKYFLCLLGTPVIIGKENIPKNM
ncbi:hypothetical protein CHY_0893 [Carboxydothermus hydrogenoformans Z-2901]|uniref:Uncharacterized protein n=1 Tax=Carboxydothermus hydrogenoformans (strain ATCC BAA-161 / DSM 6008 / Z-2901) TaxID=246194 RepID=Q3ADP1_CARHZ|nr:hypothetical protein CHY_0893 [Carboxydothermus hydrogenoformans Z-2901]